MRIEDVHNIRLKRAQVNHETYKALFDACCNRIRRRVSLPKAPLSMCHAVPPFVWGRPPYQHSHAVRYVAEKLRRNGFAVSEPSPGMLCVEWPNAPPKKQRRRSSATTAAVTPKPHKPPPRASKDSKLSARLAALRKQLGS